MCSPTASVTGRPRALDLVGELDPGRRRPHERAAVLELIGVALLAVDAERALERDRAAEDFEIRAVALGHGEQPVELVAQAVHEAGPGGAAEPPALRLCREQADVPLRNLPNRQPIHCAAFTALARPGTRRVGRGPRSPAICRITEPRELLRRRLDQAQFLTDVSRPAIWFQL
jgi:hypothetical protein